MIEKYFFDKKSKKINYKCEYGLFITNLSPNNFPLSQLDKIADNDLLFEVLKDQEVNFNEMSKFQQSLFLDRIGLEN